jgi:dihydroceramidase
MYSLFPSTVDWCEKNYVVTNFIAEFYNTLSGICIFWSMYMFKNQSPDLFNKKIFENFSLNMNRIYIYSILISIGTILFHATLSYPFQLLDELPLILITSEYINILSNFKSYSSIDYKKYKLFSIIIDNSKTFAFLICLVIPYTYIISNYLQIFLFHVSLKLFEFIIFLQLYNLKYPPIESEDNVIIVNFNKYLSNINYFSYKGLSTYILALSCWLIEKTYCNFTIELEFHAMWHIFSSLGFYYFNQLILSHIHLYYILDINNDNVSSEPPTTPKFKIL